MTHHVSDHDLSRVIGSLDCEIRETMAELDTWRLRLGAARRRHTRWTDRSADIAAAEQAIASGRARLSQLRVQRDEIATRLAGWRREDDTPAPLSRITRLVDGDRQRGEGDAE